MKVNILGTEYTIITEAKESEYSTLEDCDGYTDSSIKQIVVRKMESYKGSLEDLKMYERKVLRHEIVHAFLYESGLDSNCWAKNEEIVDWIAIQVEKMIDTFKKVNALNNNDKVTIDISSKELTNTMISEINKMASKDITNCN